MIRSLSRFAPLAAVLLLALPASSQAVTYYWDVNGATVNGAATGTWSTGSTTNWSTDIAGTTATGAVTTTSADDVNFAADGVTTGTISVTTAQAANSITFRNAVVYTVSGAGSINLGGSAGSGIFQTGNAANVLSTAVVLNSATSAFSFSNSSTSLLTIGAVTGSGAGPQTITVGSSNTGGITLNGIIGNGGGTVALNINNTNTGVTILSGVNTFTGGTTVTAGTLRIGNAAGLGAAASTVSVLSGGALDLNAQAVVNANALSLSGTGVGGTGALTNSGAAANYQAGVVNIATSATIGGSGSITIGSATANTARLTGTGTLTKVGAGTLTLSTLTAIAPIQSVMPININAGQITVQTSTTGTTTNPLGTGAISMTPGATLNFNSGGHTWALPNNITIANAAGTAILSATGTTNSTGNIAFTAGASTPTFQLRNPSTAAGFITSSSGTITGTGNLQLNGTGAGIINVTGAQNQTGTISNVGTSSATATLSGTIGSGITGISQAGSSTFTVSSSVPLSATLNSFTSTGAGAFNFTNANTFNGTQPLTFNANSTGGITVSGTNLNHTGTVTNSGTNIGTTTISSALGVNVGNVIQNSATSALVLSGTNSAYTGTYTITNGVLQFNNAVAMTGFTGTPNANVRISVANVGILGFAYPAFTATNVTDLVNNANGGTYRNVTFAPTGASIGLNTTAGSTSFSNVLANPTGSALGLVKLGTNTLILGNANTYSGQTWVQNGTLSVSSVGNVAVPVASSLGMPVNPTDGTISLGLLTNAGTLSYIGAGETSDRNIALAGTTGGGTIDNSGGSTLTLGGVTSTGVGAKTLTISGASNTTFAAAVAGGGIGSTAPLTIAKTGAGTLLLGAPGSTINTNTVTQLNITGGIVDIGTSGLTISNSGLTVIDSTVNTTINATGGGTLTLSSNTGTNAGDIRPALGTTLTINANISTPVTNTGFWTAQGGGLELNNSGTLVLNGTNTIAGVTSITAAGTISVGNIATNLGGTTGLLFSTAGSRLLYTGGVDETTAVPLQPNVNSTVEQAGSGTLTFSANWVTGAAAKTVTLQGSTAGLGVMSGIISNNSATNTTAITKAGTGTWTLSGANTYTGATTVNGGNLRLTTGTTNNSAVTVNNGGTLSIVGNYTIGNAVTAAAGGRLTLAAGGTLDLADGSINDLTLTQNATFASAGAAFNGGTIRLDVSGTDADSIINSGGTVGSTSSGSNFIVINPIAGFAAGGAYTIISGGAGSGTIGVGTNIFLATSTVSFGGSPFTLALSQVGKDALLTVTEGAGGAPGLAYWNGTTNSSWAHQPGGAATATNWVAAASGGPDTLSLPGSTTNVVMTSNTVGVGGLTTTIDTVSAINSLNFTGTGSSNTVGSIINAGSGTTLTINAATINGNAAGNGMTVAPGSGANLINVPIVLGANQTWTNNGTTVTTISGAIGELTPGLTLTKAGTGPMTLSGAASNTYSGLTTVIGSGGTAGALTLAKTGGAIAVAGNLTVGNGTATQAHVLFGENEQISPTATVTLNGVNGGWAYLQLQGRTQTIGNIVETTPGFGVIETREAQVGPFGTSNVIFNVASGTQTYQGYFRDRDNGAVDAVNSLKMTKTGAGTLQWGAAAGAGAAGSGAAGHNYSGGTDIQNGTLQLLAANSASAISIVGAGNVSLNGGTTFAGTLDLNGFNAGITGLDGTTGTVLGQVVNNGAATAILTIGNNGNSGSFAGLLLDNNNAGTGILRITKIGTGTQVLSGANTYTGITTLTGGMLSVGASNNLGGAASNLVFDGGTLQITGTALTSVSTIGHTVVFNATKTVGLDIADAGHTFTVDQVLNQTTGGFTKLGAGTVVLNQANTYTGTTIVDGGTLRLNGNTTTTAGTYRVGNAASSNGTLIIEPGSSLTTTAGSSLLVGVGANSVGVVTQNGGAFAINSTNANNNFVIGSGVGAVANTATANGSFGAYNLNGGTVAGSQMEIGNGGGVGLLTITDGTFSPTGPAGQKYVIISRFGTSTGVVTVAGSGAQAPTFVGGVNSTGISLGWTDGGNNSRAELNIGNLGLVSGGAAASGLSWRAGGTGNIGIANLQTGGTLQVGLLNIAGGTPTAIFNFNGGTLRATQSTATFMQGLTSTYVQSGGALINTNTFNITIGQPLLAPTGSGVSSLTLSGSGYESAPYVSITGDGVGATAVATIDGTGNITGFTITNPGVNYTTATVTLVGGGGTGTGSAAFAANTSGGLTKTGLGTLTLSSAANSYSGVVTISGGTLQSSGVGTLANIGANSALGTGNATSTATNAASLVLDGGTYNITGTNASVSTDRLFTVTQNGGGVGVDNGTAGFLVTFANTNAIAYTGTGDRTLTLSGAHAGSATNFHTFAPRIGNAGSDVVSLTKTGTTAWALTNAGNTYSGPTTITGGVLSVPSLGGIVGAGLASSHLGSSSNAAANLVLSGGTLQYTGAGETSDRNYTFGNATTAAGGGFDTSGATGPLVISGSMTGANVAAGTQVLTLTSLAASGANTLNSNIVNSSGTALTGVTKAGVGAWNLAGTNTYTGATTINQGKLALTGGSLDNTAITVAANATITPIGAAGSYTAGNATTAGLGASLSIASGGTLNMQDGAIGTFTLTQEATFTPAPLALASANLFFDIGSAGPDKIVVNGGLTNGTFTGTNVVNLAGVGSSLTPGTYSLITAPGILAGNTNFKFDNGFNTMSLPVGLLSYPLTLTSVAGIQQLQVGAGLGNFTWTGQTNGNGVANSVWTATPAANNNFADLSPAVQDYTDGSSVTFQDLNVITAANVTNSTVTIDAAGVLPGSVTVNNSAVNYTINTGGVVGIAGAIGLTKTGSGTLTLSSVNTYTGTTNINGGIVNVGVATALGSGTIAFGGGTLQYGSGVTTDFSSRFSTAAGQLISIDTNGNNVALATALTSVGGTLTKSGAGILTVTGANTFNGAVTVNGGTLLANYNTGTAVTVFAAASTINVAPGATFRAVANDAGFTVSNVLTGSGTVEFNAHAVSGSATAQAITFNGVNSGFSGTIRLLAPVTGTYRVAPATTSFGTAAIDVQSGAQLILAAGTYANNLTLSGTGYADANGNIGALRMEGSTWTGNITIAAGGARIGSHSGTGTISGSISGNNLTVNATNYNTTNYTLVFTGANSYGTTTIGGQATGGTGTATMRLNIGANGTTGTLGTGAVTINGDGMNGLLAFDRADGYTLATGNTITGAGTSIARTFIEFDTQGTGFNSNGVAITLGTAAAGGTFRVGQNRANTVTTINSTLTGAQLNVGSGAAGTNATLNLNSGAVVNVANISVALGATGATMNIAPGTTVNATGNFFLGDQSGWSGTVTQSGGDVTVGSHIRVNHWPNNTSAYNISGGTLTVANINTVTDPSGGGEQTGGIYLGIDGTGTMAHSGGTVTTDWIVLDNRVDTPAGINQPDGIDRYTLSGNGLLVLRSQWGITQRNVSTAVTLAGGTIRNGGTNLQVRLDTAPDISGAVTLDTVSAGNSFNWTRNAAGAGSLALSGGGTLRFATTTTQVVSVPVTGTGALEKLGTGTTTLSSALNTYNGATTISAGTLQMGVANALPSGANKGNVVFSAPATSSVLDLNGFDTSINGLSQPTFSIANLLVNNATGTSKTLTLGNNDATATFAGIIANNTSGTGTLALTKTGTGTQTLFGTNSYTGPTSVAAGELRVNGSTVAASAVTVSGTGTLSGTGTVGGAVTVNGKLSPGATSPGTLTVNNNVTFQTGSTFKWEISGTVNLGSVGPATPGANFGTSQDLLVINGGTNALLAPSGTVTFDLTSFGGIVTLDPSRNYSFLVAQTAGTPDVTGFVGNISTVNATGPGSFADYVAATAPNGGGLSLNVVGNNVYLNATVPEPGTILGLAAAGMGLAGWVRRRRTKA